MNLERATDGHLRELMGWFPDRHSCLVWGGPQFRHPFTETTFVEDTRVRELPSFALVDADDRLLAFGQYYERVGRCHLGRLVVSPGHRGGGLGRRLIGALTELGSRQFDASECSLFVARDNVRAAKLYRELGFLETDYPEHDPAVAPYLYMVATAATLKERLAGA